MEWDEQAEVTLFRGIMRYRPVGIHKNFHMICLHDYFNKNAAVQVSIDELWNKLETLYDTEALDEMDDTDDESEDAIDSKGRITLSEHMATLRGFSLPIDDYETLMDEHRLASSNASARMSASPSALSRSNSPQSAGAESVKVEDEDDDEEMTAEPEEDDEPVSRSTRNRSERESSSAAASTRSRPTPPASKRRGKGRVSASGSNVPSPRTPITTTYADRKSSRRTSAATDSPSTRARKVGRPRKK